MTFQISAQGITAVKFDVEETVSPNILTLIDSSQSKAIWRNQDPNTTLVKVILALVDLFYYYQKNPNKNCGPPSIDNCSNLMGLKVLSPDQDVRTNKFIQSLVFRNLVLAASMFQ